MAVSTDVDRARADPLVRGRLHGCSWAVRHAWDGPAVLTGRQTETTGATSTTVRRLLDRSGDYEGWEDAGAGEKNHFPVRPKKPVLLGWLLALAMLAGLAVPAAPAAAQQGGPTEGEEPAALETHLNDLAPFIALASVAIATLAAVFAIRGDRRKSGIDIRADFTVASAVSSAERWVAKVRLENLKDRTVNIYKIYLEVGHGLHIEVEDFTERPLSLDAYGVYQQEYDPVDFYSHGLSRVTGFLSDEKVRQRLVLTTVQGRYYPKRGTKTFDDPFLDTILRNYYTGVVHPMRLTYKGRSYGSNAKFVVELITDDGAEERVPIYPHDYQIRKFSNFSLTRESLDSQPALERFLREQIAEGRLSRHDFKVVDLEALRQDVFKEYSGARTVAPQGWFDNKIVGRGLTLWDKFNRARQNRARRDEG